MLVLVILAFLALFSPPLWFAVIGYFTYLMLTGKKRRKRVIMREIASMLKKGVSERVVNYIHYSAAVRFAKEHGSQDESYKPNLVPRVEMSINGLPYIIYFQRWMKDDVLITIHTPEN